MPSKPDMPCTDCGKLMWRGRSSADTPYCLDCRRAETRAKHGTDGRYADGCRCDVCREHKKLRMRAYVAKRNLDGRPINWSERKKRSERACEQCSVVYMAISYNAGRFCSRDCANDAQGRRPTPKFKVTPAVRLSIYERDGWNCQLCECQVSADANYLEPDAPTLDHIIPRAHGGSDDPSNLRLACRDCNTKRGTNESWVPLERIA